jgi:hypothetical protein
LTKKIHSQPRYSVRMPPRRTPIAAPEPAIAPRMPSALFRSDPSSNVTETIEKTDGERIAPAAPWARRAAMSIPAETERPQISEVTAKRPSPIMKSMRRPRRSPARPPSSRKPPNVSAYPLITHCRLSAEEKFRSDWIDGSATFTIETSRTTIR